jgi:hypothetical protein
MNAVAPLTITPIRVADLHVVFGQFQGGRVMAKTRKPNAARKPPVPSDSHAEIEDWIRGVMPDLNPIVRRLDESIRETIPGLQYAIKWKKAYYGLPEQGWIIEIVAYDVSVNVVFLGGADFGSPPPLGDTGPSRYVKVTTLEEAQTPAMHTWIEQAARVPGWK